MTFGRIRSEAKFRSASAPASSSAAFAFGGVFFSACPSQEEVNKNLHHVDYYWILKQQWMGWDSYGFRWDNTGRMMDEHGIVRGHDGIIMWYHWVIME